MINRFLNKLKAIVRDLKNNKTTKQLIKRISKLPIKKYKRKIFSIIEIITTKWKFLSVSLFSFIFIYYGIGAMVSSKINNSLNIELKTTKDSTTYLPSALTNILKSQIEDTSWAPGLPIIFPASVLDNLPNFQIGVKNSLNFVIKQLAIYHNDINLKEANNLLSYPENIWLFSKTNNELAPGSAKQYRKAISHLIEFGKKYSSNNIYNLIYTLKTVSKLLNKQIQILDKQVNEHHSEFFDITSDNIFYQSQGTAFTSHYILFSLIKDYQITIVNTKQYDNITTALMFLEKVVNIKPLFIKNSSPTSTYNANHLLYVAYYLSQAQIQIQKIIYNIENAIEEKNNAI